MSEHLHSAQVDSNDANLPNESFPSWLKGQTALFISQLLGSASVVYVLAALIYYLKHFEEGPEVFDPKNIQTFIIYAHIPFLLLFVVSLLNILDYNAPGSYRSRTVYERVFRKKVGGAQLRKGRIQLRKFKLYFLGFWVFMLVLYFSFIIQIHFQASYKLPEESKIVNAIKDLGISVDIVESVDKIKYIKTTIADPEVSATLNKLKTTQDQRNLAEAIEIIRGVDVDAIIPRVVGNIKSRNSRLIKIKKDISDIDSSKAMMGAMAQLQELIVLKPSEADEIGIRTPEREALDTQGLKKDLSVVSQTPGIIDEIKKINNSRKVLDLADSIQEVSDAKIQAVNSELINIKKKTESANKLLNGPNLIAKDWGEAINYLKYPFIVFAANNLSVMWIFLCFTILAVPWHKEKSKRREKRLRLNGTFIILLMTISYPLLLPLTSNSTGEYYDDRLRAFMTLADAVSGVTNAIIFALLIARLDSKLIGLRSYLITILYGYAAVQPLFVVFDQAGEEAQIIKALVLVIVFIFKIHFFLIITYAIQTGRMMDYLICFPALARRVDSIFDNQFEIEPRIGHKDEGFVIKNRNLVVYRGDGSIKTGEEYVKKLEKLRELMKQAESYRINHLGGTYWVEVFDASDRIGYSYDLKSEKDAKDLIAESIEKIPYCKIKIN